MQILDFIFLHSKVQQCLPTFLVTVPRSNISIFFFFLSYSTNHEPNQIETNVFECRFHQEVQN